MTDTSTKEDVDDLPVWMKAIVGIIVVVAILWAYLPTWQFILLWVVLFGAIGLGAYKYLDKHGSLRAAFENLRDTFQKKKERAERVEPLTGYASSKLKTAVGLTCEVPRCTTQRSLHVHHIKPRSQGGTNRLSNLIVVCRNHHADCDNGAFNRTQQREIIRGDRFGDESIKDYWRKSVL